MLGRGVLLLCLLVALGAVLYVVGGGAADGAALPSGGTRAASQEPSSAGPSATAPQVRAPRLAAGGEAAAVGLEVRVVTARGRQPVPGATVTWVGAAARELSALEQEQRAAERAESVTTDDAGVALVPAGDWCRVFATAPGGFGTATFDRVQAAERSVTVPLEPDASLDVRVLDADGGPAAGVDLVISEYGADGRRLRDLADAVTVPVKQADGLVRFVHLAVPRAAAGAGWRVRPVVPGWAHDGLAFDPERLPSEPIVVRLPPGGGLRVRLAHDGAPLPLGADGWVAMLSSAEGGGAARKRSPDADGWVRFATLPLGREYRVSCRVGAVQLQRTVAGPRARGEELDYELDAGEAAVWLVGRVIDRAGAAWAERAMHCVCESSAGVGSGPVRTDAAGRFVWALPLDPAGGDLQLHRLRLTARTASGATAGARPGLSRALGPGVHDLGDFVLTTGTPLVTGRLVTAASRPFVGAAAFTVERATAEGLWQPLAGCRVDHDPAAGTFAVHGASEPGAHRLIVDLPGVPVLIEPQAFAVGQRALRVVVQATVDLAGSALLAPGAWAACRGVLPVRLALHRDGAFRLQATVTAQRAAAEVVRVSWRGVPEGVYTLEVKAFDSATPLLSWPGIRVSAGGTPDPRLERIDLRRLLQPLAVRVVDPSGEALFGAEVLWQPDPAEPRWKTARVSRGLAEFLVPRLPIDLVVGAKDHRPMHLLGAAPRLDGEPVQVTLQPWPSVEVSFDDLKLPLGVTLTVQAGSREQGAKRASSGSLESVLQQFAPRLGWPSRTFGGRPARLTIPDHAVPLRVWIGWGSAKAVLQGIVPDQLVPGRQRVRVTVPVAARDAALRKLGLDPDDGR